MRSGRVLPAIAFITALAVPAQAYAAEGQQTQLVPDWLSVAAAGIGLLIAILLLVDAILLRRVAEGSIVADNIAYMMSGVVCFGAAMLARWVSVLTSVAGLAEQTGWAADLLVTAGMALLAVYFLRVRLAMQRYLDVAVSSYPGADELLGDSSEDDGEGGSA